MSSEMPLEEFLEKYERTTTGWAEKARPSAMPSQRPRKRIDWELKLLNQIRLARLPEPVREYRFHPTRQWRLDFAWPVHKVACEVEGGVYSGGRHVRGVGFEEDCVKYNELAALGWALIRVTPTHIREELAVPWLTRMIRGRENWQ